MSADEEKRQEYEARQKAILDYDHLMCINWEDGYTQEEVKGDFYWRGEEVDNP